MKCAVVYFSGTGNTEYAARKFKEQFEIMGIECLLVDSNKKKSLSDEFDYFVFGAPIHVELFPRLFINWVKDNISNGRGRKCIVFSTQAGSSSCGIRELAEILERKGYNVTINEQLLMPNNYYIVLGKKYASEEIKIIKEKTAEKIKCMVNSFISNKPSRRRISTGRLVLGKGVRWIFLKATGSWAKKSLDVNYEKCVKCAKCVKNCPTKNISLSDVITFKNKCISCQKCIHKCPVNAFRFKGKHFEQYKI